MAGGQLQDRPAVQAGTGPGLQEASMTGVPTHGDRPAGFTQKAPLHEQTGREMKALGSILSKLFPGQKQ